MEPLRWFAGSDSLPRLERDLLWGWGTLVFSAVLLAGYLVIAFNWYLQRRMLERAESRRAAKRLLLLVVTCLVCGVAFFAFDMPWVTWRAYDVALLALGLYTWGFVSRMRGLSLVDERLAEVRELQTSVAKYRELSDYLPSMVWTACGEGTIDFGNLRWADYVGDGNHTWLETIHPDDERAAVASWEAAVQRRETLRMEVRLRGLAGYRTFLLTATPLVRGQTVRWLGALADIEDQKQLAAERERQAKQRAFMLNALSHDLRAPLNAVSLNAQLLKMSAAAEPAVLGTATAIADGAQAAGALVSKLLEYARLGAKDENELSRISVPALLAQLERRFAPTAQRKGLALRMTTADFDVYSDRMKLERILTNLLENAVKFTERGSVTVDARRGGDGTAVIHVSDTGMGVPEPDIPFLFNEFYQVNNNERDQTKGFGMGLAICRCLARQLGGDVHLVRTGATGSTFQVTLRATDPRGGGRPAGEAGVVSNPENARLCSA